MKGPLYKWGLFLYLDSMRVVNAVMAHKDFYWNDLPEEELKKYLVFTYNDIKTNIPNVMKLKKSSELDDRFYSEFAQIKYIRKKIISLLNLEDNYNYKLMLNGRTLDDNDYLINSNVQRMQMIYFK